MAQQYSYAQQCQGTVQSAPTFNPTSDCEALKKAMKGLKGDGESIINIICNRSNEQRQKIRQTYQTLYKKDLIKRLQKKLYGHFEDVIVALMYTPAEFDAQEIYHASRMLSKNESTVIEILATCTKAEIRDIKTTYKKIFGKDLKESLFDDTAMSVKEGASESSKTSVSTEVSITSPYMKRLLTNLTENERDERMQVDQKLAQQSAQQFQSAGFGNDTFQEEEEVTFISIVCTQSCPQLQAAFEYHDQNLGRNIEEEINKKFEGKDKTNLLALVKIVKNPVAYFAERLNKAMVGLGTNDRVLIRIIVSRSEKDLVQIKQEFQRLYANSLEYFINDDTSGKYRNALITLVREAGKI